MREEELTRLATATKYKVEVGEKRRVCKSVRKKGGRQKAVWDCLLTLGHLTAECNTVPLNQFPPSGNNK